MKKRMTFTLEEKLLEELKKTSDKTLIPQARLVEAAIEEKLKEYNKEPERS